MLLSLVCNSVFAILTSSMARSTSLTVILRYFGLRSSGASWLVYLLRPPGESEFCRLQMSFGRPLPIVPLFCGVVEGLPYSGERVIGVSSDVSPDSLSESWMVNVRGDFMKRPSCPRSPVPLLLGSCVTSYWLTCMFSVENSIVSHRYGMIRARYGNLNFIGICTIEVRFYHFCSWKRNG